MKINKILVFSLFIFMNFEALSQESTQYYIALKASSLNSVSINEFDDLKSFGLVKKHTYENGLTRVYLTKLNGLPFDEGVDLEDILKKVRKKNAKAYKLKANEISSFSQPHVELKEQEIIISLKINPNQALAAKPKPRPKFAIKLKCSKQDDFTIKKLYGIEKKDDFQSIELDECRLYYLAGFNSKDEAASKLIMLNNCKECQICEMQFGASQPTFINCGRN